MCVCQIKRAEGTKLQWHWAMTEHLIEDEKWPIESFRWRQKNEASAEWKCRWWQQPAERVCLSDSLQGWWSNELQADLGVVSLPATNATWQPATLTFLHVGCCLPTALLPGLPGQLLCTLILINTHWCPRLSPRARPFCGLVRFVHVQGVRDKTQVCFCRSWLLVSMVCYQTVNTLIDLLPD